MGFGLLVFGCKVMMIVALLKLFFHKKEVKFPAIFYGISYFIWRLIFSYNLFLNNLVISILVFAGVCSWLYWVLKMEVDMKFYLVVGFGSLVLLFV